MRCFISINIPEEIKKEIKRIQDFLPEFRGNKTEIENLHLTLKFLGEVDKEKVEEVKKKLREVKNNIFQVEFKQIGVFSEKFIRIIWLKLTGAEKLQKEMDDKLSGLFAFEKRFMSHLTIARVKSIKDKKKFISELMKIKVPNIKFTVNEFRLMESVLKPEGPTYSVVEKYILES